MKLKESVFRKSVCAALMSCAQIMGLSGCVQMHLIHAANAKPDTDVIRSIKARLRNA
nr:hypothetical protein [uncultured Arsenicibacter sp.]